MSKNYPKYKVAATQIAPVFLDAQGCADKACKWIKEAADNGAKLIGFPEGFISGYPWWIWLMPPAAGADLYTKFAENAVEIPGPIVKQLSDAARENKIYVCISVTEKDGGSLYLTQLWFNPAGDLIGKHRKLKPSGGERLVWGEGDASMMPVFDTELGRLGGLQCWEHWIPLNIQAMNSQNEQVHVASWPSFAPGDEAMTSAPINETASKFYAQVTGSYVLACSQIHTQEIYEGIGKLPPYDAFVEYGGGNAFVVGPNGKIMTEKLAPNEEGIIYADIDLGVIPGLKYEIDPAGHYSNKMLTMTVDKTPKPVTTFIGEGNPKAMKYDEICEALEK